MRDNPKFENQYEEEWREWAGRSIAEVYNLMCMNLRISIPREPLLAEQLPGPWRIANDEQGPRTGWVFHGRPTPTGIPTVALHCVSMPLGLYNDPDVLALEERLEAGWEPEEMEPSLKWVEIALPGSTLAEPFPRSGLRTVTSPPNILINPDGWGGNTVDWNSTGFLTAIRHACDSMEAEWYARHPS